MADYRFNDTHLVEKTNRSPDLNRPAYFCRTFNCLTDDR